MTHTVPLLHDPLVRSILRSIEQGAVPLNLVELLAPQGQIHPETATLLHRLLALPDAFERDVLTLASMLPHHPARHTIVERINLCLYRATNPTEQGYLLACLARINGEALTAGHLEDLADQLGGQAALTLLCRKCNEEYPLCSIQRNHPLADVAEATSCHEWRVLCRRLEESRCPCEVTTSPPSVLSGFFRP